MLWPALVAVRGNERAAVAVTSRARSRDKARVSLALLRVLRSKQRLRSAVTRIDQRRKRAKIVFASAAIVEAIRGAHADDTAKFLVIERALRRSYH